MKLPPRDLAWFAENLTEVVQDIIDAWNSSDSVAAPDEAPPELLKEALEQLIDVLKAYEWKNGRALKAMKEHEAEGVNVSELGEYGLSMLGELAQLAKDLGLDELPGRMEQLALSLALWVLRQHGELHSVELVVNGLARLANNTSEQAELEKLFHAMGEVLDVLAPVDEYPLHHLPSPLGARKTLLLNRAIVATRTLSPPLMEVAFSDVAEELPDSAPGFFAEGVEQVGIQHYPPEVSAVIERFHRDWPLVKTLH